MSVMYEVLFIFCDWHHPSFQQTAKDETAYTQVSDKPDDSSQTAATTQQKRNGSYIAMSPVEAQKCWSLFCLPRLRKGVREQHMGVVLQWVGFTHSGRIFGYPRDGGGGMDASSSECWHCFSHRALSWLCPRPCCPHLSLWNKPFYQLCSWLALNTQGTPTSSARTTSSFYTYAWNTIMWPVGAILYGLKRLLTLPKLRWLSFPLSLSSSSVLWEEN